MATANLVYEVRVVAGDLARGFDFDFFDFDLFDFDLFDFDLFDFDLRAFAGESPAITQTNSTPKPQSAQTKGLAGMTKRVLLL
jgi:hypothetical protein